MLSFHPSPKLARYLRSIEKETGRRIIVQQDREGFTHDSPGAFVPHPAYLVIVVRPGWDKAQEEFERLIAHEATHGLLLYGRGYSSYRVIRPHRARQVGLVATMLEDIVVNKLIQDEGFPPFQPSYLRMLDRAEEAARSGRGICARFAREPSYRSRFMVFHYILAWGLSRHCRLTGEEAQTIRGFLKALEATCPQEFREARRIKHIISRNDIFTPAGHRAAVEKILRVWGLEDSVVLEAARAQPRPQT